MVPHSHRQCARFRMPTQCVVTSESTGELLGDRLVNASYDGLLVTGSGSTRLGQRVKLSIRLPGSSLWLEGSGHVARIVGGRRRGDPGPGFGVRVSRMNGMSRVLLASVLRRYPDAGSARGPCRDYAAIVARIARR